MTLGDLIKKYRDENSISMDYFAQKSGLSKSYVSMLERNKDPRGNTITPSIETIVKVAKGIGEPFENVFKKLDQNQKIILNSTIDDNIMRTIQAIADAISGLDMSMVSQSIEKIKDTIPEYNKVLEFFTTLSSNDYLTKDEKLLLGFYRDLGDNRKRDVINFAKMLYNDMDGNGISI